VRGRPATEKDRPTAWELRVPYKRTKLDGETLALRAAHEGGDVVVVNPTTPIGPGDHRPTPTGKMVADVASGRAKGYLAAGALNIVAVEDVAAGQLLAFEHGRVGQRYLLGGENLTLREVFGAVAHATGRSAPRIPVPWTLAYLAAQLSDRAARIVDREPTLLVLDEVRVARWPMTFDDSLARRELGYTSRSAAVALEAAALASQEMTR
jgi:dihydroflavonol-4-reductase